MSLVAFPVLWKNAQENDLGGIVDLQLAELPVQGAQVKDLFPLLNAKINAQSPSVRHDLEVEQLLLYGTPVSRVRTLDALIPELEGSPRFIAILRAHASGRIAIFIKTLTAKKVQLNFQLSDIVGHLKSKLGAKERIAANNPDLLFAATLFKNHLTPRSYGIESLSELSLIKKMPPRIYADLPDISILTEHEDSRDVPKWRIGYQGLNIEGKCECIKCEAYQKMVVCPKQFEAFNLLQHDNIHCPICFTTVKPRTCGFSNCLWKIDGIKTNKHFILSQWKKAFGKKYYCLDADKTHNFGPWKSLLIVAKPPDELTEVVSPLSRLRKKCTICWGKVRSVVKCVPTTVGCGHSFHDACIDKWAGWCVKKGVLLSCPVCRSEIKA